jgi:hypothetical protein
VPARHRSAVSSEAGIVDRIEIDALRIRARSGHFRAAATVEGQVVAQADLLSVLATIPSGAETAERWSDGALLPPKPDGADD